MFTRVTLAVAIVLMVSSGAFASVGDILAGSIWQQQAFTVGNTTNPGISTLLNLVHGDAEADMYQFIEIDNWHAVPAEQNVLATVGRGFPGFPGCHDSCKTEGSQWQSGFLEQDVEADGKCGIISANAFLDAAGAQEQSIGAATSPKMQEQLLGVAADQVLMRSSGGGSAEADNYADLYQTQDGGNAAGSMSETSWVTAGQYGDIEGKPNSTVSLVGGLNAGTTQAQIVY